MSADRLVRTFTRLGLADQARLARLIAIENLAPTAAAGARAARHPPRQPLELRLYGRLVRAQAAFARGDRRAGSAARPDRAVRPHRVPDPVRQPRPADLQRGLRRSTWPPRPSTTRSSPADPTAVLAWLERARAVSGRVAALQPPDGPDDGRPAHPAALDDQPVSTRGRRPARTAPRPASDADSTSSGRSGPGPGPSSGPRAIGAEPRPPRPPAALSSIRPAGDDLQPARAVARGGADPDATAGCAGSAPMTEVGGARRGSAPISTCSPWTWCREPCAPRPAARWPAEPAARWTSSGGARSTCRDAPVVLLPPGRLASSDLGRAAEPSRGRPLTDRAVGQHLAAGPRPFVRVPARWWRSPDPDCPGRRSRSPRWRRPGRAARPCRADRPRSRRSWPHLRRPAGPRRRPRPAPAGEPAVLLDPAGRRAGGRLRPGPVARPAAAGRCSRPATWARRPSGRATRRSGLTRALLHSGTSTVISGVAKVSDRGAADLMADYHRRLAAGPAPAYALADALAAADEPMPFACFGAGW